VAQGAHADVVTFNDVPNDPHTLYADFHNNFYDGGLHFKERELIVMPVNLDANPVGQASRYMEAGNTGQVEPITLTHYTGTSSPNGVVQDNLGDNSAFDLWYLKIGLGDGNTGGTDVLTIDGIGAAGCTACNPTMQIDVTSHFQLITLVGFTNLARVTINQQHIGGLAGPQDTGWLGFDDIVYTDYVGSNDARPDAPSPIPNANVPEPSAWALMIVGFGGVGVLLRRNRRRVLTAA
jgi:hypothetical protein